ncbi:MAG: hypothetical protein ACRC92_21505 [Peptostreptococcaceae bacterium]
MQVVLNYIKKQINGIEDKNNKNRLVQMSQLENYINRLRVVISELEYKDVLKSLTESEQGKRTINSIHYMDLKEFPIGIISRYDNYLKEFTYSIQLYRDRDKKDKTRISITKRLVRGL